MNPCRIAYSISIGSVLIRLDFIFPVADEQLLVLDCFLLGLVDSAHYLTYANCIVIGVFRLFIWGCLYLNRTSSTSLASFCATYITRVPNAFVQEEVVCGSNTVMFIIFHHQSNFILFHIHLMYCINDALIHIYYKPSFFGVYSPGDIHLSREPREVVLPHLIDGEATSGVLLQHSPQQFYALRADPSGNRKFLRLDLLIESLSVGVLEGHATAHHSIEDDTTRPEVSL